MSSRIIFLVLVSISITANLAGQKQQYDVGQMYSELQSYADNNPISFSWLAKEWPEIEQWRIMGRAKMQELLSYSPRPVPLNTEILETVKKKGYTRYKISYAITQFRRTEAYLLIPDGLKKPAPAVIALHDHGGFYYFGKEKITETENPPKVLTDFISKAYDGRTYADELARRGFVVLCPDAFYFGSQRLNQDDVTAIFTEKYPDIKSSDENEAIRAYNEFCSVHEGIMAKYIFDSGTTWPGIMFHSDRIAVDYLMTRPEVDPQRIGCIGLSIGGFRSANLFGLDPRISVCVDAGWMTSFALQIDNHLRYHTWMIYTPRQLDYLDLPDVASLNAPRPLMIINCKKDALYSIEAMQSAENKLEAVYQKLNAADHFKASWYDVPHMLNIEMQNDAIDWLEKWLKK